MIKSSLTPVDMDSKRIIGGNRRNGRSHGKRNVEEAGTESKQVEEVELGLQSLANVNIALVPDRGLNGRKEANGNIKEGHRKLLEIEEGKNRFGEDRGSR
jgi:hypothetical protein